MTSVASAFPDLDIALTVSRVEVVSNVEIETIKVALRWLYDQAQKQREAGETADAQKQIDDLHKSVQEQSDRVAALQEQQVLNLVNDVNYVAPPNCVVYSQDTLHASISAWVGCWYPWLTQGLRCLCLCSMDRTARCVCRGSSCTALRKHSKPCSLCRSFQMH